MGVAMISLGFQFQHSGRDGSAVAVVLHRRLRAVVGTCVLGAARGNVPELHQEPGDGAGGRGAVGRESVVSWSFKILIDNSTLNALFNHGFPYWMYGVFSFLSAVFVYFLRAGDQAPHARRDSKPVDARQRSFRLR